MKNKQKEDSVKLVKDKAVRLPVLLDGNRHQKLKAASATTRLTVTELVKLSIDNMLELLKDPYSPDFGALGALIEHLNKTDSSKKTINRENEQNSRRRMAGV